MIDCFDVTALERLAELLVSEDRAELEAFIDECRRSMVALIEQAEEAQQAGHGTAGAEALRRVVHTLASQSALIGAEELAELARRIEARKRADPRADMTALVAELGPAYQRFERAWERERDTWSAR